MLNIFFLGLVSFFTDLSTEMVYPLIPLYLAVAFGATPALIGLIEGISESLASLLKVYSGYISDRFQKKKALAFSGYAASLFYKIALVFATSWVGILGARVIDKIGKGIRTAPRDVLVSDSIDPAHMGKAFGLHKSLDKAGAALGILITYFLLKSAPGDFEYKKFFLFSMIPAVLALCMFLFIKEKIDARPDRPKKYFRENFQFNRLDARLKTYLLVVLLFTLGNSSNAFLLLKAKAVGFTEVSVILLYFIYNVTASAFAMPFGKQSDKIGRKRLLVCGYLTFTVVYAGFAYAGSPPFLTAMFALYGLHTAMITGVERALVAEIAPKELKGTMLGLHATIAGIALLPASVITGLLWNWYGATVPFLFGALMSLLAAVILILFLKPPKNIAN